MDTAAAQANLVAVVSGLASEKRAELLGPADDIAEKKRLAPAQSSGEVGVEKTPTS